MEKLKGLLLSRYVWLVTPLAALGAFSQLSPETFKKVCSWVLALCGC
jgi:hypothetical protein